MKLTVLNINNYRIQKFYVGSRKMRFVLKHFYEMPIEEEK